MSLAVGSNSWVTTAEADTYLTDRIGAEAWFALSGAGDPGAVSKEVLLVSAYTWLINNPQLELSASLTDVDVKAGQIEAALFLLEHYDALNERRAAIGTGVKSFGLSKRREILIQDLTLPLHIAGFFSQYGISNAVVELKGHYDI